MNVEGPRYYSAQSRLSSPGPYADLYDDLPTDVPTLCGLIQGLLVHVLRTRWYGFALPPERKSLVLIAPVPRMLQAILEDDPGPLARARPPKLRFAREHPPTGRTG